MPLSQRILVTSATVSGISCWLHVVEADIWQPNNGSTSEELLVGHTSASLKADRILSNLHVQPLVNLLQRMNAGQSEHPIGIVETNPDTSLVLLLDFKSDGEELWQAAALHPLRAKGWLRHWNGTMYALTPAPITIVATGNAPLDRILTDTTYRDVFFDAPLDKVGDPLYNTLTLYYTSTVLRQTVGTIRFIG